MDYVLWFLVEDICVVYVDDLVILVKHKTTVESRVGSRAASPTP